MSDMLSGRRGWQDYTTKEKRENNRAEELNDLIIELKQIYTVVRYINLN